MIAGTYFGAGPWFFFSSRRRHTRSLRDWSSDVCSSDLGIHHYDSVQIGISVGFTAFALMMVAAAYECRSETGTILAGDTFNSRRMNLIAGARSEERRVGKEGRDRGWRQRRKKKAQQVER